METEIKKGETMRRTDEEIKNEIKRFNKIIDSHPNGSVYSDALSNLSALTWVLNNAEPINGCDEVDHENEQEKADRECEREQDNRTQQYIDEHRT
jgi:hypothetical protein